MHTRLLLASTFLTAACLTTTGCSSADVASHTVHVAVDYDGAHSELDMSFPDLNYDDRQGRDSSCGLLSGNCGEDATVRANVPANSAVLSASLHGISDDTLIYDVAVRLKEDDPGFSSYPGAARQGAARVYENDLSKPSACTGTLRPCTVTLTKR